MNEVEATVGVTSEVIVSLRNQLHKANASNQALKGKLDEAYKQIEILEADLEEQVDVEAK